MFRLGVLIALLTAVFMAKDGLADLPNEDATSNVATGCLWRGRLFDVALGTEPRRGVCPGRAKTITFPIQPPSGNENGGGLISTYQFFRTLTSDRPDADNIPFDVLEIPTTGVGILVQAWCSSRQIDEDTVRSNAALAMDGDYDIAIVNEDNNDVRYGSTSHLTGVGATLESPSSRDVVARTFVVKLASLGNGAGLQHWLRLETLITVHQTGSLPATCSFSGKAELFSAVE